jgi:predicted DNA-binding transcriptional regulator AlpA
MPHSTHQAANVAALLDKAEVLRLFGGSKPINASTLYRGIKQGRYPRPVKVGPGTSRWLREECEAALRTMVEVRS